MKFKHYENMYQRSKKSNKDNFTILELKDITINKPLLNKCAMLKEASLSGDPLASGMYTTMKNKLNCINVHNIGNILENEFITTNFLCYDIDNLTEDETKRLFRFCKTISQAYMISPSQRGVKLFFKFEDDTITKNNLKLLYENFGKKVIGKINNTLGTNISLDISSKDLNRLCFMGEIVINEDLEDAEYKACEYFTTQELRDYNKMFNFVETKKSGETPITTDSTLTRLENTIQGLRDREIVLIHCYDDLMKYGFMFASLTKKDSDITPNTAYTYFKEIVKLGEEHDQSNIWMSKSGSGSKYNIAERFNDYLNGWGQGMSSSSTIGSFFHTCKDTYNITGFKIIYE